MFFNLNNSCYFIKGNVKGVIYNLESREIVSLSQEESEVLWNAKDAEMDVNIPVLKELVASGWGFFSDKLYFVDKIRPYSRVTLMRADLRIPQFDVAFLQLTNQCHGSSENCRKKFCTPCRTDDVKSDFMSAEKWKQIIDNLFVAKVRSLILTGGDVTLHDGLTEIIDYIFQKRLPFSVVLHPAARHLEKIDRNIPIQVYTCDMQNAALLLKRFGDFKSVTIMYNQPMSEGDRVLLEKSSFKMIYTSAEVRITQRSIRPCNVDQFFRRKNYNDCLNGKMFINFRGDVIPCLQSQGICLGNVFEENFDLIYRKLIVKGWNARCVQPKCNACEWYYGCSVCMFMDPDKICQYDEIKAEWK